MLARLSGRGVKRAAIFVYYQFPPLSAHPAVRIAPRLTPRSVFGRVVAPPTWRLLMFPCRIGAAMLCAVALTGCTSMKSTMLHRGEFNDGWYRERPYRGVPITMKVATHVKVTVYEHHFMEHFKEGEADCVRWIALDVPVRSVDTEIVKTEKVITVDTKRPAAGTMSTTLGFTGQYFNNIDYHVEDKTIDTITEVIGTFAPGGIIPKAKPAGEQFTGDGSVGADIREVTSVAAHTLLAIDAPDFEAQLVCFLNQHLTGCHTCRTVGPGMSDFIRLPPITEEHACTPRTHVPCETCPGN
jgi:hypothetical protein